jgi:hypothetical protein
MEDNDPRILNLLPFPVAYPLSYALNEKLPSSDRIDNCLFSFYQAMKVFTLVSLSEYLQGEAVCLQLERPIRGIRLPHWGEWKNLADSLARYLQGFLDQKPGGPPYFPALVQGWWSISHPSKADKQAWEPLLAQMPGLSSPAAPSLVEALWKARNDRAHRLTTRTPGLDETQQLEILLAVALQAISRLFEKSELTLAFE